MVKQAGGADASVQAYFYQLASYHRKATTAADMKKRAEAVLSDAGATVDLFAVQENSVDLVSAAVLDYYDTKMRTPDPVTPQQLLDMVQKAVVNVFKTQLDALTDVPSSDHTVNAQLTKVFDAYASATPMLKPGAKEGAAGAYVTSLSAFLGLARTRVFDNLQIDGVTRLTFTSDVLDALFLMMKPWLALRFLASFLPGDWNRAGAAFAPNYQEIQFARLAMFRVVFEGVRHVHTYLQPQPQSSADVERLSQLLYKLANTLSTDVVSGAEDMYPQWQTDVAAASRDSKQASLDLFQLNAQLQQRKSNLMVMLQNQRELQKERVRQVRWFWVAVAGYVVALGVAIALLVTRQYRALYIVFSILAAAPAAWFVVALLRSALSSSKNAHR